MTPSATLDISYCIWWGKDILLSKRSGEEALCLFIAFAVYAQLMSNKYVVKAGYSVAYVEKCRNGETICDVDWLGYSF